MKAILASVSAAAIASVANADFFNVPIASNNAVQRIDPILAPNTYSQHCHEVFGSNALGPGSTFESLRAETTCTTVRNPFNWDMGNADDRSVYWHPCLYMQAKDGSGWLRIPTKGHQVYYENRCYEGDAPASPFDFPTDFSMIAGNGALLREPAPPVLDTKMDRIGKWICHPGSGPMPPEGPGGGFPKDIVDCEGGDGFAGTVFFPHCWNGQPVDPANPTSHMAYGTGAAGPMGPCPPTHQICLPQITVIAMFDLHSMVDKVVPNTFTLSNGDPTGFGWHADFQNGWTPGALDKVIIQNIKEFESFDVLVNDCTPPVTYAEEVDQPGQFLPGCNPVSTTNPAPNYAAVPIGVSTDQCALKSGGGGGGNTTATLPAASLANTRVAGNNSITTSHSDIKLLRSAKFSRRSA